MRGWIFQTIDRDRVAAIRAGESDRWCVRRYRHEMQRQDLVFIWLGGSPHIRGIHAWGVIASDLSIEPAEISYHVDVQYKERLIPFIPAAVLRDHPVLSSLAILHMPRATNFRLSYEEVLALEEMIGLEQELKKFDPIASQTQNAF